MGIKKEEEDVKEEYEMFLRDQKIRERRASTLRPMLHGHPGFKIWFSWREKIFFK